MKHNKCAKCQERNISPRYGSHAANRPVEWIPYLGTTIPFTLHGCDECLEKCRGMEYAPVFTEEQLLQLAHPSVRRWIIKFKYLYAEAG